MCRERLEIGVQVGLAVLRIDEAMEAIAGLVVVVLVLDHEVVVGAQLPGPEPQPMSAMIGLHDGRRSA